MKTSGDQKSVLFLTVDIGTSSTKAVLWDLHRNPVAQGRSPYPTLQTQVDRSELDPDIVYRAFLAAMRLCLHAARIPPKRIVSISLSSAMHCLVGVDVRGKALFPIQTWADNRSSPEALYVRSQSKWRHLPDQTGCPIHASFPLVKLRWLAKNNQRLHDKTHRFVSLKSYCLGRWLGVWIEDWSMASGTGLFDVRTFRWHPAALRAARVDRSQLPELVSPYQIIVKLSQKAADLVGLAAGTAVIPAAGDGPLANLGSGRIGKGDLHLSLGTSGAVRVLTRLPLNIGSSGLWCYVLDDEHWVVGGSSNNGASILEWFFDRLKDVGRSQQAADRLVKSLGLGPVGLLFYPYIHGERSLYWNSQLRGALLGITSTHSNLDFLQAAIEGIAFQLKSLVKAKPT